MPQEQTLRSIIDYFRQEIFEPHLNALENKFANLDSYAANPFLSPYLSRILENEYSANALAKTLYFSRTLSTSINTSFGTHIRKVLVKNNLAQSINSRSNIISFTDRTTNLSTGCLLKAGPRTINSGDIVGIRRTLDNLNDVEHRAIGVIYGSEEDMNASYQELAKTHNIFLGKDFWHRITGDETFYGQLSQAMIELSNNLDIEGQFQMGLERLTNKVEERYFN